MALSAEASSTGVPSRNHSVERQVEHEPIVSLEPPGAIEIMARVDEQRTQRGVRGDPAMPVASAAGAPA